MEILRDNYALMIWLFVNDWYCDYANVSSLRKCMQKYLGVRCQNIPLS
jgi:hypothetical protein